MAIRLAFFRNLIQKTLKAKAHFMVPSFFSDLKAILDGFVKLFK